MLVEEKISAGGLRQWPRGTMKRKRRRKGVSGAKDNLHSKRTSVRENQRGIRQT